MSKIPPVHLSGPHAKTVVDALKQSLKRESFSITKELTPRALAVFVTRGAADTLLERWLAETAACRERWVCMPRLSVRAVRSLEHRQGVRFLVPGGTDIADFRARILGELYLSDPGQPEEGFLVGRSTPVREMITLLNRFAPVNDTVLIQGESGTGKELCARFLHRKRGMGKQISVNCAAFKPDLVESELFGHERGAFTGANTQRRGLLTEAGAGTCFLDEIGELRPQAQAAVLRVLEEREVRPVGGNRALPMNARLVMATHRDLRRAVTDGSFREDLFHRIAQLTIRVPPLRDRMEDVPLLVGYFLEKFNRERGMSVEPPTSYDCFFRYDWPGNVRELGGKIQHAMLRGGSMDGPLDTRAIEQHIYHQRQPTAAGKAEAMIPFYKGKDKWKDLQTRARAIYLADAYERCGGINARMQEFTGLGQSILYKYCKELGIGKYA